MNTSIQVTVFETPVTAAYHREGKHRLCTALEFDLVGVGKTRQLALQATYSILTTYLEDVLDETGPVSLFNPSEPGDWNRKDKEHFRVSFTTGEIAVNEHHSLRIRLSRALRPRTVKTHNQTGRNSWTNYSR